MKTAFLIPGFTMDRRGDGPEFQELREAIAAKGYRVLGVPFVWNHKTISEYLAEFISFYEANKSGENIIIGNSLGAMVAFMAAAEVKPDRVLLCSLSAYFREDLHKQTERYMLRKYRKRRTEDFRRLSADETARRLNNSDVQVTFLIGEKENWGRFIKLRERVEQSAKAVKGSKLVVVPNAPHPFRNPAYIRGIAKEL